MNSLLEDDLPGTHHLRDQLLGMLTDQDLAYKLPGANPTLGAVCEEMGYAQQVSIQSFKTFKTFKQEWGYRTSQPDAPSSVASLTAWYKQLDVDLVEALSGLAEDDVHNKQIDRGEGCTPTVYVQFLIYHEAVLIFYAKASAYLKALDKPSPDEWRVGIG